MTNKEIYLDKLIGIASDRELMSKIDHITYLCRGKLLIDNGSSLEEKIYLDKDIKVLSYDELVNRTDTTKNINKENICILITDGVLYGKRSEKSENPIFHYNIAKQNRYNFMTLIFGMTTQFPTERQFDKILIISGGDEDYGINFGLNDCYKSVMDFWKYKFKLTQTKWPEIIYWDVNQSKVTFLTSKYDNVELVSISSKEELEDSMLKEADSSAEHIMMKILSSCNFQLNN